MTIEIGRLVVKTAGRDASKKGVIVDILDDKYVLIDGETRRRKVNILHIEPLSQAIKISKKASHDEVAKALDELGIKARVTKPKPKTQKPKAKRKTSEQLRVQKEEKRKLKDIFKPKKKEEKAEGKEEVTLEEKAGLVEEGKEETKEVETKATEKTKETKPKEKKTTTKKTEKKEK